MKVALYTRCSSESQENLDRSIPAQLKAVRDYVTKKGYSIYKEYSEPGESAYGDDENREKLRTIMNEIINKTGKEISPLSREKIFYYVARKFMGYDKINVMMTDPMLEDISCDGVGFPLYVFHREFKNIKTNITFLEHEELDNFVINLAQKSGKSISIANPVLDATLPDGSRLNQTLGTEVTLEVVRSLSVSSKKIH